MREKRVLEILGIVCNNQCLSSFIPIDTLPLPHKDKEKKFVQWRILSRNRVP